MRRACATSFRTGRPTNTAPSPSAMMVQTDTSTTMLNVDCSTVRRMNASSADSTSRSSTAPGRPSGTLART